MIASKYEHHTLIRTNNSQPFILKRIANSTISVCNWHKNIELLLFTEGAGRVQYGLHEIPAEPGDIVIINSNAMHCISSAEGVTYDCLIIDHIFCENNGIDVEKLQFTEKTRDAGVMNAFTELITETSKTDNGTSPLSIARIRRAVLSLLIELCSRCISAASEAAPKMNSSEELVKRAMNYIGEHYSHPIRLEELSCALNVSASHLARAFKRHTGQTIITYANILRCQKAALCISSGMNITEAALECGFETLSYFSRTYKKLVGESPSKIRI